MSFEYPESMAAAIGAAISFRAPQVRMWMLCDLFFEGKQDLQYDRIDRRFVLSDSRDKAPTVVVNRIAPLVMTRLNSSGVEFPEMGVVPMTGSADALTKAFATEFAIRGAFRNQSMPEKLHEVHRYCYKYGQCAQIIIRDKSKKKTKTRTIKPQDFLWESGAKRPNEADWCAEERYVRRSQLLELYPDKKDEIEEAAEAQREEYGWESPGMPEGRVLVHEIMWQNGKCAIVLGAVYLAKWDSPGGTWPMQYYRYIVLDNKIWGKGMIESLIPLQVNYNELRTQILQNMRIMGNPMMLVPYHCKLQRPRATVGGNAYYNPAGGKPEIVPGTPMPQQLVDQPHFINNEMNDTAQVYNSSMGKRTVGVTSGKGMAFLDEKASQATSSMEADIMRRLRDWAKTQLAFIRKYNTESFWVSVADGSGSVVHRELKKEGILGDASIFIEPSTLYREDREARENKILQRVNAQILPPEEALKLLNEKTSIGRELPLMVDLAHAMDILDGMKNGISAEIFPTDNLDAFTKVFSDFIKTAEYYGLDEDRQDEIRDLLVAVQTWSMGPGAYDAARDAKVFPRVDQPQQPSQAAQGPGQAAEGAQMRAGAASNQGRMGAD